jgi:Flp pilus assembly protein TadD
MFKPNQNQGSGLRSREGLRTSVVCLWLGTVASVGLGGAPALAQSQDLQSQTTPSAESTGGASTLAPTPEVTSPAATPTDSTPAAGTSVTKLVQEGDRLYAQASYKEAIAVYTQALAQFDLNAYAYYNRANAYRKLEDWDAALLDYSRSLQINPDNAFAYLYRGQILAKQENYTEAIADFTRGIEVNKQEPMLYVGRAEAHAKTPDLDAAREDFQTAIDLLKKQGKELQADRIDRQRKSLR